MRLRSAANNQATRRNEIIKSYLQLGSSSNRYAPRLPQQETKSSTKQLAPMDPILGPENLLKTGFAQKGLPSTSCCITQLLQATYAAGGHGHLEQPPTASWEEDCTQQWIQGAACCCVHLVAFCSSFPPLQILGCICDRNSLENIMGKKDASCCYVSRLIAEYPLKLAESFANIAASLIDSNSKDLSFPKRWHHFL